MPTNNISDLPVFAVCTVFLNENDDILAVERLDGNGLGLPAGKLNALPAEDGSAEPGTRMEDPLDGAVREPFEETGLIVDRNHLVLIYERVTEQGRVQTYLARRYTGTVRSSEEGIARWVTKHELLNKLNTFSVYNREVLRRIFPAAGL